MATWAPSLVKRIAVASPIPEVPPVMRATLSFRRIAYLYRSRQPAAINNQRRSGHERCRLTRQVERCLRDLFRLAHATQWPPRRIQQKTIRRFPKLLGLTPQHGGVGIPGAEAVYANILRAVIHGHRLGQKHH